MKPVISALLGIFALTSAASAQDFRPSSAGEQANAEEAAPLASIIAEYEAMVSAVSPGERAEMEDRAPRRWQRATRRHARAEFVRAHRSENFVLVAPS